MQDLWKELENKHMLNTYSSIGCYLLIFVENDEVQNQKDEKGVDLVMFHLCRPTENRLVKMEFL